MSTAETGSQRGSLQTESIDAFSTFEDYETVTPSPPDLSINKVAARDSQSLQSFPAPYTDYHDNTCEESVDWWDVTRYVTSILCVAVAIAFLAQGFFSSPNTTHKSYKHIVATSTYSARSIEDCEVGQRALGRNPLRDQVTSLPDPHPETSRTLVLRMRKESGNRLDIRLIRSLSWIESVEAIEGGSFYLEMEEMGAVGDAYVEAILPCPLIEEGPGNVITGVFTHEADPDTRILSVAFSNGAYLKGVTDNHPFWSVDRNEFVPIGDMKQYDWVKTENGLAQITKIDSRFARSGEMLYNLETHNEHVFQVSLAGVLVHNSCVDNAVDLQRQLAREGINGTIWKVQLSAEARAAFKADLTGKLPGFQAGARFHAMVVAERNGVRVLFDKNFTKGIPLDDWMKIYARENKISLSAAYRELEWKVPNILREAEFPDRIGPYSQLNPLGE